MFDDKAHDHDPWSAAAMRLWAAADRVRSTIGNRRTPVG
jgi:hypothetical protein